jgi:tRNA threonylcarbamoyladenosine biosynthesis protein TsaE
MTLVRTQSVEETVSLGRSFASSLKCGDVVALFGDLGTGKTHFVAGACGGLGVQSHVTSPTFTFVNEYVAAKCTVVHVDLYRIKAEGELSGLGVEEYFNERYVCFVEWADRMKRYLPSAFIEVTFAHGDNQNERLITVNRSRIKEQSLGGAGQ